MIKFNIGDKVVYKSPYKGSKLEKYKGTIVKISYEKSFPDLWNPPICTRTVPEPELYYTIVTKDNVYKLVNNLVVQKGYLRHDNPR